MVATQRLVVFTRIPESGRNKTRLIPSLGAEGATRMHDRLARHAVGRASAFCLNVPQTELEIRITGGSTMDARDWLGNGRFVSQGEGDLGSRLELACREGFDEGLDRIVIVGTDCPRLDERHFRSAFETLESNDVVIGPATDGGYYLIGLRSVRASLFEGIAWGACDVFCQTVKRAEREGLSVAVLEALPDVDLAEDLADGEQALLEGSRVSVIIPTINEAGYLSETLDRVTCEGPWEVMVADGGSRDGTPGIAAGFGATVVTGATGRAAQMNLAARRATGEFLLFIHADTLPPPGYRQIIADALSRPGVAGGAFRLQIGGGMGSSALIEALVGLRCRLLSRPYGDQGLFVRRSVFAAMGGFPEIPVMEDLRMVERLKRRGAVVVVDAPARTSGRRWESGGLIRTFLRHQMMLLGYYGKLPIRCIARMR